MKTDIAGKLRNASVPKSRPLTPVFEAIVNSFQSIQELGRSDGRIDIVISRSENLFERGLSSISAVAVSDNGAGFSDKNFDCFNTSDTLNKVDIGGKGIGRFTWLNVFEKAEINSTYRQNGSIYNRSFTFSPIHDPDSTVSTEEINNDGVDLITSVLLCGIKEAYVDVFPNDIEFIAQEVVEHCYLLIVQNPGYSIKITDNGITIDLVSLCSSIAEDRAFTSTFTLDGHEFNYRGLRVYSNQGQHDKEHKLFLTAHGRSVTTIRLRNVVPNLKGVTKDEAGEQFVYRAFVSSAFLDKNVNENRLDFICHKTIFDKNQDYSLFREPCIEEIRQQAVDQVYADLRHIIDHINERKIARIEKVVESLPQYRHLLKALPSFIDRISPSAGPAEIESCLSLESHSRKVKTREESRKVLKRLKKDLTLDEDALVQELMERISDIEKSVLAEYVAHRKVVIQFLERSLGVDPETGKHRLEKVLHSVVFPMKATSDYSDVLDNQNLWLVDERLTYHVYLASDKSLKSMDALDSDSLLRPDLLLFDASHILGESSTYPIDSFIVIEFKRPLHTDYRNDNPIAQVYDQIRQIRTNHFKDRRGREIKLSTPEVPAFAYIICDLTEDVERYAEDANLVRTPDRLGFFGYNDKKNINAYIEIISYDKLINDAKKRNRALFDKLGIDSA